MAIEFVCPACNGALEVGDEFAGRVIRCGGCMTMLRVPESGGAAPPAAPESPFETEPRPASPPPRTRPADSPTGDEPAGPRRRDPDDDPFDAEDRPRRPRRRPPPEPAGRGVFFWLIVTSALMLFGVAACCGGLYLMLPNAEWQEHESEDGGFKVELPGKAQAGVEQMAGLRVEPGAKSEGAMIAKRGKVFVVFHRDVKPAKDRVETDEQVMERAIQNVQKAVQAKQPSASRVIKVGDFAGREVAFSGDKGLFVARVVVVDSRLYIALAGGGWTRSARDADVRRFLNSFKITDEKLLKKGKGDDGKDEGEQDGGANRKDKKELPVAPPPRPVAE